MKVKDEIVSTGSVAHAKLGVEVQDLSQALANSFSLSKPEGALISRVIPDSSAEVAGLQAGDVITRIDGQHIVRSGDVRSQISMSSPGEIVMLTVWRDRSFKEVKVKLGEAQSESRVASKVEASGSRNSLGLALRPLTQSEKEANEVREGLLVQNVSGASARAGILPGDVLLAVNGIFLKSLDPLAAVLAKKPDSIALLILRGGERIFVPVELR